MSDLAPALRQSKQHFIKGSCGPTLIPCLSFTPNSVQYTQPGSSVWSDLISVFASPNCFMNGSCGQTEWFHYSLFTPQVCTIQLGFTQLNRIREWYHFCRRHQKTSALSFTPKHCLLVCIFNLLIQLSVKYWCSIVLWHYNQQILTAESFLLLFLNPVPQPHSLGKT